MGIKEHFAKFIGCPSLENYLAVRGELVASTRYQPYSDDLTRVLNFVEGQRYREAIDAYNHSLANLLLSPRAHVAAGIAYKELGQERESQAEFLLARLCIDGIRLTGDGTRQRPFQVTQISDEYDIVEDMGKKMQMQSLSEANGRRCDVLTLEGDGEVVFDIQDCFATLARRDGRARASGTPARRWWQFWRQ